MFRVALPLLALALVPSVGQSQEKPKKTPNILFIMSDDHASASISCYGPSFLGKYATTPNIDRIAKGGVRFKNSLVTNSICTPSRAAILTGQYSNKNGVYTLSEPLDAKKIHLGHWLRSAGYATALIGKWHLMIDPTGFDYWNVLPGQGVYHNPVLREIGAKPKTYQGEYSEDVITTQSLDWLKKRDKSKPFFLCVHYKAPHRPWDPAERFKNLYKDDVIPEPPTLGDDYQGRAAAERARMRVGEHMSKRDLGGVEKPADLKGVESRKWAYQIYMKRYLGCVAAVDENVGRLLDYLDQEGLTEDTIVIYTSDQGFYLGEHGWYDKRFMYEPSMTTPLVLRYPAQVPAGQVIEPMVMNIDHAPTFLDFAGAKAPADADMDGRSYRPLLQGKTPPDWRKSAYYRYWMHLDGDHNVTGHYGVRTDRYTLIYFPGKGFGKGSAKETPPAWELFDRKQDPEQMRNVINDPAYRETVAELKLELERLRKEVRDTK